jgi:beta-glucosidase
MGGAARTPPACSQRLAGKGKQSVKIPLACFTAKGADLASVDTPFSVSQQRRLRGRLRQHRCGGRRGRRPGRVRCEELQ